MVGRWNGGGHTDDVEQMVGDDVAGRQMEVKTVAQITAEESWGPPAGQS